MVWRRKHVDLKKMGSQNFLNLIESLVMGLKNLSYNQQDPCFHRIPVFRHPLWGQEEGVNLLTTLQDEALGFMLWPELKAAIPGGRLYN